MSVSVLVVDDDPQIRRALTSTLTRAGFGVATAENGETALVLATTTTFDILLVDYNMGSMTGAAVVERFKARFGSRTYCAVLSGEDSEDVRDACAAAGVDTVIMKPAPPRTLRDQLIEAASGLGLAVAAVAA